MTSSRFSSTAMMKKKIASRPSLIQCRTERSRPGIPRFTGSLVAAIRPGPNDRLAATRPRAAERRRIPAAYRSDRIKLIGALSTHDRVGRTGVGQIIKNGCLRPPTRLPGSPAFILAVEPTIELNLRRPRDQPSILRHLEDRSTGRRSLSGRAESQRTRHADRDCRAAARPRRLPVGRRPDSRIAGAISGRGEPRTHRSNRSGQPRRDDRGAWRRALPGALPRRHCGAHERRRLRHSGCRGVHDSKDGGAASACFRRHDPRNG